MNTTTDKESVKSWWRRPSASRSTSYLDNYRSEEVEKDERFVFGVDLHESIQYAYTKIVYEQSNETYFGAIPLIIAKCGAYLKNHALTVEGIFRISGNSKRITLLQNIFNHSKYHYGGALDWTTFNVHDASAILRRYLNQLPEPIIHLKHQVFYKKVLEDDNLPNIENKITAFQNLIGKLPLLNQYLLFYLLDLLHLFSLYSESTRMDIGSLATAFTPCIFSDLNKNHTTLIDMTEYSKSKNVLLFLIQHQQQFQLPNQSLDVAALVHNNKPLGASMSATHLVSKSSPPPSLKRSQTMPTNRQQQSPTVTGEGQRHAGRWKSIKLTVKS